MSVPTSRGSPLPHTVRDHKAGVRPGLAQCCRPPDSMGQGDHPGSSVSSATRSVLRIAIPRFLFLILPSRLKSHSGREAQSSLLVLYLPSLPHCSMVPTAVLIQVSLGDSLFVPMGGGEGRGARAMGICLGCSHLSSHHPESDILRGLGSDPCP